VVTETRVCNGDKIGLRDIAIVIYILPWLFVYRTIHFMALSLSGSNIWHSNEAFIETIARVANTGWF